MALTNGITLVNKIKSLANAIRRKTDKTGSLTIDQMVSEIDNEWKIKCYVKEFYVRDAVDKVYTNSLGELVPKDGDWEKYFDRNIDGTGQYALISYTTDGRILLTARSTDGGYENIEWELGSEDGYSLPSGISMTAHSWSYSASPTGNSGQYQTCILKGINKNCRIVLDCGSTSGSKDSVIINVFIYYI
jgi:hypothetical protein